MQIQTIASYKFVPLSDLVALKTRLQTLCTHLKGTVLISEEGINLNLSGRISDIVEFKKELQEDPRFKDLSFRESNSNTLSFKRLKIKIKKEIITFRQKNIHPEKKRAPSITPEEFKNWLDQHHEMTILDTRNDFEVNMGTFRNALTLNLKNFCELPDAVQNVNKDKPVVMFCTGGIRCEKASLYLLNSGFSEVYQLEGGILNYFAKVGGSHFQGNCFVFDDRIALNSNLEPI